MVVMMMMAPGYVLFSLRSSLAYQAAPVPSFIQFPASHTTPFLTAPFFFFHFFFFSFLVSIDLPGSTTNWFNLSSIKFWLEFNINKCRSLLRQNNLTSLFVHKYLALAPSIYLFCLCSTHVSLSFFIIICLAFLFFHFSCSFSFYYSYVYLSSCLSSFVTAVICSSLTFPSLCISVTAL